MDTTTLIYLELVDFNQTMSPIPGWIETIIVLTMISVVLLIVDFLRRFFARK